MVPSDKIIMLPNGLKVINTTPHPITFETESGVLITVPSCGFLLNAKFEEKETEGPLAGLNYVKSEFLETVLGRRFIDEIPEDVLIIGSLIAAQTYNGEVALTVPFKGGHRKVAGAGKTYCMDKFTIF